VKCINSLRESLAFFRIGTSDHFFDSIDEPIPRLLRASAPMTILNSPLWLCRGLDHPCQCGLYRGAEIGVGEVGSAQLQPGGDPFEKGRALLWRQAASMIFASRSLSSASIGWQLVSARLLNRFVRH